MADAKFVLDQLAEIAYNMDFMRERLNDWTDIVRESKFMLVHRESQYRDVFLSRLEGFAEHADELKTALYSLHKHFKEDSNG